MKKHYRGSSLEQKIEDYWKKRFAASVTLQNAGPETVCLGLSPNKGQCGEWLLLEYNWAVCSLTPVPRLVPVVCLPVRSPHYILCIDFTIRSGVSPNISFFCWYNYKGRKPICIQPSLRVSSTPLEIRRVFLQGAKTLSPTISSSSKFNLMEGISVKVL